VVYHKEDIMKITKCSAGFVALFTLLLASGCGEDGTGNKTVIINNATPDMSMDMGAADQGTEDLSGPGDMGDMSVQPDQAADMADMASMACQTAAGCSAPRVCALDSMTGQTVCKDPVGSGETGAMCQTGADCRSNLCVNRLCAAPCQDATSCPAGFACEPRMIPLDGGSSVTVNVCVVAPKGCLANADCQAPQLCVVDRSGTSVTLTCQAPVPGGGELGARCGADGDCLSGLCLNNACSQPCERPNDCAQDGSYLCEPTTVSTASGTGATVNLCKPRPATQCLSDAQCVTPQRCIAQRGANGIDFVCGMPNAGAGEVGALCGQDDHCASNLCLSGRCAPPCQGTGDCRGAADYLCELREVQLPNNVRDSVQVCTPPTLCDEADDCRINETCYVRRRQSTIDLYCRAPNAGGGTLGQVCTQDSECASNLCHNSRFGRVCSMPCAQNADCPVAGYECTTAGVASQNNTPINTRICAPRSPAPCNSNDDCATGLTCAIVPNISGSALESVCIPTAGRQPTGVACGSNDACSSRLCLGGFCAAPCEDTTQCGGNQLCALNTNVNKDNLVGTFNVCRVPQDTRCAASDQCADGVRVCGELRQNMQGDIEAYCRFPNTGAGIQQLGAACTMDNQCREGLCSPLSNECSVVCNQDAHCNQAAGQICATFSFGNSLDLGLCTKSCADNASCPAGLVCTINPDPLANDIDQICQQPAGMADLGAPCASANECHTGLCLSTLLYNNTACTTDAQCGAGNVCRCPVDQPNCQAAARRCATVTDRCTRVCDGNSDCTGGVAGNPLTACSPNIFVTRPDGMTTKQMSFCSQP
jgi:hypothetical protein